MPYFDQQKAMSYPSYPSSQYFSQVRSSGLWYAVQNGLDEISWPGSRLFARQGWIVFLQGFLALVVMIAIYRHRKALSASKHWRFIAARPFSAGLFLGTMATLLIYELEGTPAIWKLTDAIVGGISFARLIGGLIEASWKRQFVYGLMIVFIVTRLMDVFSFPLPLFRLYTLLTALIGLLLCLRWAGESGRHKDPGLYPWSLRLGSLFFGVIMIAELWGKKALATYLFVSSIRSMTTVLVFMLFMYMIHGGLEGLFRASPLGRTAALHKDTDDIIRRIAGTTTASFYEDGKNWTDPIFGVRTLWNLYRRWSFAAGGNIGGFGVGSEFTWMASIMGGYRFRVLSKQDNASVFFGYRALYQDYTEGSGADLFEYKTTMHGPIVGVSFGF
jgi:hypothetical protein